MFHFERNESMRKWLYLTGGIIIGATGVCLVNNSKKVMNKMVSYGDTILQDLNNKLEQLALMVENLDEEKFKKKMKSKYENLKKRVMAIDWQQFGEEARSLAESLKQEINDLLGHKVKEVE